jgi:UDP-N-acetylglucosamine 2-epimerase
VKQILFIFGTRPEAIKLCPIVRYMQSSHPELQVKVCVTAQHRGMLDQVLRLFGVRPRWDLNIMKPGQTLTEVSTGILKKMGPVLEEARPLAAAAKVLARLVP